MPDLPPSRLRPSRPAVRPALAAVLAALALLAPAARAQGAGAVPLSYAAARAGMLERSDRLAAARAGVEAGELQSRGLAGLGGPSISISGAAYAYGLHLQPDLSGLSEGLGQIALPGLGALLPVPLPQLPQLVSDDLLHRHDQRASASVSAVWPLYLGGATDAARGIVAGQTQEARADAEQATAESDTLLAQRYFGAQLAQRAADLRAQAERTIAQHDAAAQKMLDAGVISRVERLQAQAAYEDARRQAAKARDDAELAATALARTVHAPGPVAPDTPLFVLAEPIEPLGYFLDAAMTRHPGLAKVAAKKQQAEQLHAGQEALRRPQVFAFGTRQLRGSDANWVAGIGARWTLLDALDRNALAAASLKKIEQAERSDAQARSDIALLVERNWRAVENARRQVLAMAPAEALAREVLRLRTAGLREGTSTTLDLIDAETRLAQVLTERAQAANDYVQALAQLLQSAGLGERLPDYIARSDIRLE
ncbi:TolC family protein [Pseudorhodoferax sp.]|uniref:TolC family protein n=1 Tax=Pseudorhodoferax sp. TaxID=1993553 RepID=UPI0039E24DA1